MTWLPEYSRRRLSMKHGSSNYSAWKEMELLDHLGTSDVEILEKHPTAKTGHSIIPKNGGQGR